MSILQFTLQNCQYLDAERIRFTYVLKHNNKRFQPFKTSSFIKLNTTNTLETVAQSFLTILLSFVL